MPIFGSQTNETKKKKKKKKKKKSKLSSAAVLIGALRVIGFYVFAMKSDPKTQRQS